MGAGIGALWGLQRDPYDDPGEPAKAPASVEKPATPAPPSVAAQEPSPGQQGIATKEAGDEGADKATATVVEARGDSAHPGIAARPKDGSPLRVYVIPVREEIGEPLLYVVRRGLKDATASGVQAVVLDMKTPGGRGDVMLEIMEALDQFPGRTLTYVDDEASSAGALIAAVTDDIYFAPRGTMGSAEPVTGQGTDIGDSMKRKVTAFIAAKIEAYLDTNPRRAEVIKAMMEPDFELKIGDQVIKAKGELLNLPAKKAVSLVGDPPLPLLGAGIADNLDDVLHQCFGPGAVEVTRLDVTWSERLYSWLNAVSGVLFGLGLLALYIEFKTPGFGVFGFTGIALLLIVFFGQYTAGLSGHEPMLVFGIGVLLLVLEVFVFPTVGILAVVGLALIFGSFVWATADLWPGAPVDWSGDVFLRPLGNLGLGLLVAVGTAALIARYLPRGSLWKRMVLSRVVVGVAGGAGGVAEETGEGAAAVRALVGREGVAATALFPSGQVEIGGARYEARVMLGFAEAGTRVVVRDSDRFGLVVEALKS